MRFTDPLWGLLFVPLAAYLFWSWSQVLGMALARKRLAFALRFLVAGLVIVALMGPQSVRPNKGVATVFVVDRSDSIRDEDKRRSLAFVRDSILKLGPDDQAGIVVFGKEPAIESVPGGRRDVAELQAKTQGSASNLAAALRLAAASFPEGKGRRIVALTDGNETSGDAIQAVDALANDGIQVDFVSLGSDQVRAEASVLELAGPSERSSEEAFDLRVVMESTVRQSGTLVIDRDGEVVSRLSVTLEEGKSAILVPQKLDKAGFYRYRATLQVGQDTDNRNNLGAAFVAVKGKPRILVVQSDTSKRELALALQQQGLTVDLVGPGAALTRPEDLQPYDGLIFNDFNASFMAERQMNIVRAAVRDTGIGFMMVGGEDSFLPGGWYGTPVAEVLPVDLNVRQRKSFPSTTVLVIVDTSGSMSMPEDGVVKLDLAAMAAVRTAELMSSVDKIGVIGSSDFMDFVAPIQPLTDKERVIAQIKKLAPGGGGIYAEPSVVKAEEVLSGDTSKVRHFILLADGADCDQHGVSVGIAARMLANKITTTAVAIGDGKDVPFLKQLAAAGGGRFYLADKASKLPQIFTQDVSIMSRSAIEEGAFVPRLSAGEEALRGIGSVPPLLAYCISEARPLARVGMWTKKDDPLLARWQFGLGTSVAFTSDAQNRWAKPWMNWEGFSQFWSQSVRTLTRKRTLNSYDLSVEPEGGKGRVTVVAKDPAGNPLNQPEMSVRVSFPDGQAKDVGLIQDAPGRYVGSFGTDELGSYIVSVSEEGANGQKLVGSSGFAIPYPPEYRQYRTNQPLLNSIAERSGGRGLTTPEEALRPISNPGQSISDLWSWFLLAAAVLFPLDVAARRVALPLPAMWAAVRAFFSRRPEAAKQVAAGRLVSAKKRVRSAEVASSKPVAPMVDLSTGRAVSDASDRDEGDVGGRSAASKLLEAKKRRRGEGE